jgi:hypothetical protein
MTESHAPCKPPPYDGEMIYAHESISRIPRPRGRAAAGL